MAELDPFLWLLKVGGSRQEPVARLSDPPRRQRRWGWSLQPGSLIPQKAEEMGVGPPASLPGPPEGHRDGDGEQDVPPCVS